MTVFFYQIVRQFVDQYWTRYIWQLSYVRWFLFDFMDWNSQFYVIKFPKRYRDWTLSGPKVQHLVRRSLRSIAIMWFEVMISQRRLNFNSFHEMPNLIFSEMVTFFHSLSSNCSIHDFLTFGFSRNSFLISVQRSKNRGWSRCAFSYAHARKIKLFHFFIY